MKKIKLGDILDVKRGASLSGEFYADRGERIRLTLGNFNYPAGGFKENTSKTNIFFVGKVKQEFILKKGDIITPLTEQVSGLLGETARIPENNKYIQSGDIGLVIPDENLVDNSFVYYLISSPIVKKQLDAAAQQTKIRHTSPEKIKDCEVWLPDIRHQKFTGELLDVINEKIKNNNKIIAELESMAKTIYDYWFLQFEFPNEDGKPYKSSGGKMVWNKELKKEIPVGWKVGNLYEITEFINGLACQKYRPVDYNKKIPVIKIKEMHEGISESTEYVREDIPEKNIVSDGDILFSWSATLETMIWAGGKGGLNQHIFKVIPKEYAKYYVYMQLSAYIINFVHMAEARKTTMGHITTEHLIQSRIAIPPKKITYIYEEKTQGIFNKIICNSRQNRELILLRNFLLPLLMNEQIRFKERM